MERNDEIRLIYIILPKIYTWEPRGFLNFPQDAKMGFKEIYPRGIFIYFEESSSRNYFLEESSHRGLFLFIEEQEPRDVNTRFFSRYHPRGMKFSSSGKYNFLKNNCKLIEIRFPIWCGTVRGQILKTVRSQLKVRYASRC